MSKVRAVVYLSKEEIRRKNVTIENRANSCMCVCALWIKSIPFDTCKIMQKILSVNILGVKKGILYLF